MRLHSFIRLSIILELLLTVGLVLSCDSGTKITISTLSIALLRMAKWDQQPALLEAGTYSSRDGGALVISQAPLFLLYYGRLFRIVTYQLRPTSPCLVSIGRTCQLFPS